MATKDIFNAETQQVEAAELSVDPNNEIVATFANGRTLKFPAGLSAQEFEDAIDTHQEANSGQTVLTPEYMAAKEAERAASLALIGESEPTQVPVTVETQGQEISGQSAVESAE